MPTPTAKTETDLAKAVLRAIRVARPDEDPSAEDRATVLEAYRSLYAELLETEIAFWDMDAIPVNVFRPVVKLVANEVAPEYNKAYEPGDAMLRLRAISAKPWSGKVVRSQYF